ncbi:hypothetical protein BKA63DRAFT_530943 [Paraphoma chrysanthemicola]|nr:hypothetical protein BKA63DRAFT_530943 [Paraphoma chrysanthemicola]
MYSIQQEPRSLVDLLDNCYQFGASNPRDKVYGVLSIAYPREETQRLCVDYDKSVGEIHADAVVAYIQHNASLYPLCFIHHGSGYQPSENDSTSWTPEGAERARRIPAEDSPLSACKKMPVSWVAPCDVNSRQLCLEGIFYSRIDRVQAEMDLDNLAQGRKHPFVDIYLAILGGRNIERPGDLERMEVLARTLTAGCDSSNEHLDNAGAEKGLEFVTSFLTSMTCLASEEDYVSRKVALAQESFYGEAEVVCTGRRLFHTAMGDFGLVPAAARPGDIAVVLFGGDSPYILRLHNRSYLFIGQAYIDGLMKGLLIDKMEMGMVCKQEFRLI